MSGRRPKKGRTARPPDQKGNRGGGRKDDIDNAVHLLLFVGKLIGIGLHQSDLPRQQKVLRALYLGRPDQRRLQRAWNKHGKRLLCEPGARIELLRQLLEELEELETKKGARVRVPLRRARSPNDLAIMPKLPPRVQKKLLELVEDLRARGVPGLRVRTPT